MLGALADCRHRPRALNKDGDSTRWTQELQAQSEDRPAGHTNIARPCTAPVIPAPSRSVLSTTRYKCRVGRAISGLAHDDPVFKLVLCNKSMEALPSITGRSS